MTKKWACIFRVSSNACNVSVLQPVNTIIELTLMLQFNYDFIYVAKDFNF